MTDLSTHSQTRLLTDRAATTLTRLKYDTWNFGDSIAFEALVAAGDRLGRADLSAFAYGWARAWATRRQPFRRLDCTAPGAAMVRLAKEHGDGVLVEALVELADYLMSRPVVNGAYATWDASPLLQPYGPGELEPHEAAWVANPPGGVFIDCLHFDPPFLTSLGALTGTEAYWRAGIDQAQRYIDLLQVPSGLFDHFVLADVARTFGPGWGRGQGWALLGLLDVIETMADVPDAVGIEGSMESIRDSVRRLVAEMVRLQRADGHWYAVVTDSTSGEEYSTAAFMAHGFHRALALGVVPDQDGSIAQSRQDAVRATIEGLQEDGVLAEVSAAVWACTLPSHYGNVPRGFFVPWGQGPAVLALLDEMQAI